MIRTRNVQVAALVAGAVLLVGCSAAARDAVVRGDQIAQETTTRIEQAKTQGSLPFYREVADFYVASSSIRSVAAKVMPEQFDAHVSFRRKFPVTLNDVAAFVSTDFGVPVTVAQDAVENAAVTVYDPVRVAQQRHNEALALSAAASGQPMPMGMMAPTTAGGDQNKAQGGAFLLNFDGTLSGLLDEVASQTGNYWRYENGRVLIFHTDTRVYTVQMIPGEKSFNASLSADSGSGGGGGGAGGGGGGGGGEGGGGSANLTSGNSISANTSVNHFSETVDAVTKMLSAKGKISAVPSLANITVTDVPAVLDRVQSFMDQINTIASRQVVLDVQVYAVETSGQDSYGIRWDTVWQTLGSRVNADFLSGGSAGTDPSSLGITVVDPTSPFEGTSLLLEAISHQGNLNQVTSSRNIALSGHVVPVQLTEQTAYQSSVQTTLVPDAGAQTTRTLSSVTTGFALALLPIITSGDELMLEMQLSMSNLRELRRIGSETDGSLVEAPLVDGRGTIATARLNSGQTLVLTGLEQETLRSDNQGVGTPGFKLLGGNRSSDRRRTSLVILVTPRIIG